MIEQQRARQCEAGGEGGRQPHACDQPRGGRTERRQVGDVQRGRQQLRQHEARDRGGGDQAADGKQSELRQSRKARRQQRGKAADRGQHAQADGPPQRALGGIAAAPRLHEQVDRVIDRLADQRDPKAQRNAMHHAKPQRHRRDAGQRARGDRQQSEQQRRQRAVHQQQQRHDQRGAEQRQPHRLMLDGGARIDREHRGTAEQQTRRAMPAGPERRPLAAGCG